MNAQPDLAPLVSELRYILSLTQEKFAAKLGVTFPTINRWENVKASPSPLAMQQIKDLLREMGKNGADLVKEFFPDEEQQRLGGRTDTITGEALPRRRGKVYLWGRSLSRISRGLTCR